MWLVGLLIGALIGSLKGGGHTLLGAVLGAAAGAALNAVLKARRASNGETADLADIKFKIDYIYKSLEDIHWRLVRLEKPGSRSQVPATGLADTGGMPANAVDTALDHVGRNVAAAAPAAAVAVEARSAQPLAAAPAAMAAVTPAKSEPP